MLANLSYSESNFTENFIIKEIGTKLRPESYSNIKIRLNNLELTAPSSSHTELRFTKKGKYIKGKLFISGAGRFFCSEKSGQDHWDIYQALEKDITKQLKEWKKSRLFERLYHSDNPNQENRG
jgi:hypothetical protein